MPAQGLKKLSINGNVAWVASTDLDSFVSERLQIKAEEDSTLRRINNRVKDRAYKFGAKCGVFENYGHLDSGYIVKNVALSNILKRAIYIDKTEDTKRNDRECMYKIKWSRLYELSMNFVLITTCSSLLINRTYSCLYKYMCKDTSVTEYVKYTSDTEDNLNVPFIDFTVCPSYESAYKDDILKYYGLEKDEYRGKGMFYPTENANTTNPRALFYSATHEVDDIFNRIKIKTLNFESPSYEIDFSKKNFTDHISITPKFYHHFGRCYSLHPKEDVLKLGVNSIYFITKIDIYVYFGYPGQFMYSNTKSKVYSIVGQKMWLDFVYELSIHTLENFKGMSCDPNMNLNFDNALYREANAKLEDQFNCTVPFLPPIISNVTGKLTEICKDPDAGYDALQVYEYFKNGGLSVITDMPCATMDIFLGLPFISNTGSSSEAYLKIYLKTSVKVKRTVLDYDYLTLIAELGGYTGLLLGISVADISIRINKCLVKMINKKLADRATPLK